MKIKEKGFTLIELVLIIGLLILTAGVSSDIIITLIRSYNKTQITNEIEQSADFVLLKLEKELRNADHIDSDSTAGADLYFYDSDNKLITYRVGTDSGTDKPAVFRSWDNGAEVPLTDSTFLGGGVSIACLGDCFSKVPTGNNVDVVEVSMEFYQTSLTSGKKAFTGTVPIKTTIVVRGSY